MICRTVPVHLNETLVMLMQVPTISEHMRSISGVHLAVDLIQFSHSVKNAVLHAVGNSLVAETLEDAKKHAFNENGRRFKVASLDGTLIAVNGSMSGGQTRYRIWDVRASPQVLVSEIF